MRQLTNSVNPREAAYQALLLAHRNEAFIQESLTSWANSCHPSQNDIYLAQEISYGTMRMQLALDHQAAHLAEPNPLRLKAKEKILLRMSLYQYYYMDRIPLYAIVNESVSLAKTHCHETFTRFLNMLLRKMEKIPLQLPQGATPRELSIRFSYPLYIVEQFCKQFGLEQATALLETSNLPAQVMARQRKPINGEFTFIKPKAAELKTIAASAEYYIQNATPAVLISKAFAQLQSYPKKVLDLCAAPGGKSATIYDLDPNISLTVNDVSETKLARIRENFTRLGIPAQYSLARGEQFSSQERYDLIIIDAPCSNSGVLNKRPEARWRLSPVYLQELQALQLALINNAKTLLAPNGKLWYMTCSILEQENRHIASSAGNISYEQTIYPCADGSDGGYLAILEL